MDKSHAANFLLSLATSEAPSTGPKLVRVKAERGLKDFVATSLDRLERLEELVGALDEAAATQNARLVFRYFELMFQRAQALHLQHLSSSLLGGAILAGMLDAGTIPFRETHRAGLLVLTQNLGNMLLKVYVMGSDHLCREDAASVRAHLAGVDPMICQLLEASATLPAAQALN